MDVQQFEQAILKLAFETNARITAASVAYYLGIPSRDANRMLNELLREGVLELDSDEHGNLFYHVPHYDESSTFASREEVASNMQPAPQTTQDPQYMIQQHASLISPEDDADVPAHSPRQFAKDDGSDGLWLSTPDEQPTSLQQPPQPPPHPYDDDGSGYGAVATTSPAPEPVFEHPAIERHSERMSAQEQPGAYRQVLVGVTSRPMEPDAWVGNCGASPVVVTPEARCEPKPLADARPSFVSCIDPEEENRVRTVHFEPAAPQNEMVNWWQQPQPQQGAMVLAHTNNLPATMDQLEQPEHQPGMALLLSLILCGTGQIYNGEVSKGIMMMVLCFLLWFVLLGWVVHIWSIVDAVVVAERINRKQHV